MDFIWTKIVSFWNWLFITDEWVTFALIWWKIIVMVVVVAIIVAIVVFIAICAYGIFDTIIDELKSGKQRKLYANVTITDVEERDDKIVFLNIHGDVAQSFSKTGFLIKSIYDVSNHNSRPREYVSLYISHGEFDKPEHFSIPMWMAKAIIKKLVPEEFDKHFPRSKS